MCNVYSIHCAIDLDWTHLLILQPQFSAYVYLGSLKFYIHVFRSRATSQGSYTITFFVSCLSVCLCVTQNLLCPSGVRPVSCDASYDHLWCPNGPEVNRKWTGSGRKWARSGLEVSICPSVCLSIPNEPYARDLQAQGACALRFLKTTLN